MTTWSARPNPSATSPSIVLLTLAYRVESEQDRCARSGGPVVLVDATRRSGRRSS
ncbi:hypothetical protein [Nonomuraea sp. NPDC049695]|uniref:hypothetical protein n=1 Tax=Nonomuraea sp. NPDC049695 TaxID=3154734 RepID=UPI0034127A71